MMADIKFAFVACAFLSFLFLNGCAQQYEAGTIESQVNNWQATRSRLRGRAATRNVATSPQETFDNSSPDITTRNRQRPRGRYNPEPVGEEQFRYNVPQDPPVERSLNLRSRTNIKTLEDSLNTEKYQRRLERPQRRNGFVDTTEVPFSRSQDDLGTPAKRLERMRSRIAAERRSDDFTSYDSRPRSRGRTTYQNAGVEDVTPEARFSRTRGFTSRYQNVEPSESPQREFTVQAQQVNQEFEAVVPTGRLPQTIQPQQVDFAAPVQPQIYEQIPNAKPQQTDAVFPNLSTQKFSTDPAQQFARRSDTPAVPVEPVSNLQLESIDVERTTQFIPLQTQKGRSRGRTTFQATQEGSPDATTVQLKSRNRQGSFRSRTKVIETTAASAAAPTTSRSIPQTRNTLRTFRGKPRVEVEQQASDRAFVDNSQPEPVKPENPSRGTVKEAKSTDEIDETANYPKEFLEKLKKSKTYTPSKVTYRAKRRQYPTTTISPTKVDADTSETNTKETHEESSVQKDRYSQRFYKKLSGRREESRQESTTSAGTETVTEERRKFVPKKKLTAEERKERISRLKEKLRQNATQAELKAEESKESFVKESLVTQANTHPGSREVFATENVKSTVEVKSSVSSNVKRVKKQRGKVKFIDDDKDLIPLGSEEQLVVLKNETTSKKPAATKKSTTTKKPPSTTRLPRTVSTTARPTQAVTSTTTGDFAVLNVTLFPSTRHRFSARINSSATLSLPPDVELITTTTPATALSTPESVPLSANKPEITLSVNNLFNTSVTSTNPPTSVTASTTSRPSTTSPKTATTRSTTRRSSSKKKSSGKKKSKKSKTNRTTTKKPKSPTTSTTTVRPASNSTGVRPLTLAFSDIETIINETVKIVNSNSMTGPLPGAVPRSALNALTPETILNGTTEATMGTGDSPSATSRANTNSSVNSTNQVESPSRLTDVECSNGTCTKSKSQSVYFNEDNSNREPIPYARQKGTTKSPESLRKIFIYGVFPNNTVQRKPFPGDGDRSPARLYNRPTTSIPPYTPGDYYVFGVYPNNSVVRRRGWKTFDYEKYRSPYVIFGIYPNNTIIKKFPNGTTINDSFMVSDNEIYKSNGKVYCTCSDPAHAGVTPHIPRPITTTPATTTSTTTSATTTTTEEPREEGEEDEGEEEEEEEEDPDRNPKDEVENVDVESENISETDESTEQTTEESTPMPSADMIQTTPGTLEEAEEADSASTTEKSDQAEEEEDEEEAEAEEEEEKEAEAVEDEKEAEAEEEEQEKEENLESTTVRSDRLEDAEEEEENLVSTTTRSNRQEETEEPRDADLVSTTTESNQLEATEKSKDSDLISTTTESSRLEATEESRDADLVSTTTESSRLENEEESKDADLVSTTSRLDRLEEAEQPKEADLVSTTTESSRLENAEEADDASTPKSFEDSLSSSLEREESQNQGLGDAEEADSEDSDSLSNAENADLRTTERSEDRLVKTTESEGYFYTRPENENLEDRTEENETLEKPTTESTNESLTNTEETGGEDTADNSANATERTTEASVNKEDEAEENEEFEERISDTTSERSENLEEQTVGRDYEERTTERTATAEERTENYFNEQQSTESNEGFGYATEENTIERNERLDERLAGSGFTTTETPFYEQRTTQRNTQTEEFETEERNESLEEQTEKYYPGAITTERSEKLEEEEGYGFGPTTERSERLEEQTEKYYSGAITTERNEKFEEEGYGFGPTTERSERLEERTTEKSENFEEQTTPGPFEERGENVIEQTFPEEEFDRSYERPRTTEAFTEGTTTERSERLQTQETDTEQAFVGDFQSTESPETTGRIFGSSQGLETTEKERNFDLVEGTTTQTYSKTIAVEDTRGTGSQSLSVTTQRPEENTIPVKVIYEGYTDEGTVTETIPDRIRQMAAEDLREFGLLKGISATTQRPDENTIPVQVIYDGYVYDRPTGRPFTYEDVFAKGSGLLGSTKSVDSTAPTVETATDSAPTDYEIDVRDIGSLISRLTTSALGETTPPADLTEAASSKKTSADLLDALLPLSIEYLQASASGDEVKKRQRKSVDDLDEPSSLTNLAYRSLSSSETTSTPISVLTTMRTTTTTATKVSQSTSATRFKPKKVKNYSKTSVTAYKHLTDLTSTSRPDDVFIVTPVGSLKENPDADYLKRGKVKFVTLTPGVVVTTNIHDENDILTMSSQHVQKVTKAPAKIPDNFLSTVFGELEEKASSPIPDILKNVENDLQGDGLSASLARRIITLALEKAMTSTTPVAPVAAHSISTTTAAYPLTSTTSTTTSSQQPTLAPLRFTTPEPTSTTRKPTTTKKPTTTRNPPTTAKPTTRKPLTSTTRRPRTTSTTTTTTTPTPTPTTTTTTTTSTTEQTREILITPKKTQGQVSRRPASVITSPEFLQSTIGPELSDGRTAVEVPVALKPLNVLFASDKLSSTTAANPSSLKPTEDLNAILSGLFPESTPSSPKASEYSNSVTQRQKSTKNKSSLSKQASASLSESDLKILEAILQQQGTQGGAQDLEQIVQNQIRLAEEVRKASRNLRKKPRTTTTTTTERPTPLGLGFLLNLFGSGSRPNGVGLLPNDARNFRRPKPTTPSSFITLTNASQATPDPFNELDSEGTATGERSVRGELVSAAIDVTKAVSKFMGTVLSSAAQSFQNFFRNLGR